MDLAKEDQATTTAALNFPGQEADDKFVLAAAGLSKEYSITTTAALTFLGQEADDNAVLGGVYLVVSMLVMTANGVVVFVIAKTRNLHLPTLWIIAHMAVWDFLLGVHYLMFAVPSAFLNQFAYSSNLVGATICIRTFIGGQNIFSTVMMVVDRYIAIKRPLSYNRIATKKTIGLAVLVSVPLNIGRLLLIVLPADRFFFNRTTAMCIAVMSTTGGSLGSGIPFVITFAIIVFCSATIFRELLRNRRRIHSERSAGAPPSGIGKFSMMALLSASIYCLSYVPTLIAVVWNYFGKGNVPGGFTKFVMVSFLCNSIWNVFIYTATYRPFRDALMFLFCKTQYRRRRQVEFQDSFQSGMEASSRNDNIEP